VRMHKKTALAGASMDDVDAFWKEYAALYAQISAATYLLADSVEAIETMQEVLAATPAAPGDLDARLHALRQELYDLDQAMSGDKSRAQIMDTDIHRVNKWLGHVSSGVSGSSYGPTPAHRRSLQYAAEAFGPVRERLKAITEQELPALRQELLEAGAPWGQGQPIPTH
jgi:prophage DNA circulation protein